MQYVLRRSIRRKLLGYYGAAIVAVVLLYLTVQVSSYRATTEFADNLARYHTIHRLRMEVAEYQRRADTAIREPGSGGISTLDEDRDAFLFVISSLDMTEPESLEAFFALRAARRGLEAYFSKLESAVRRRAAGDRDWYQDMAYAARVAGYVDVYLSTLLSEAMVSGESRYQALTKRIGMIRTLTAGVLALVIVFFGVGAVAFSASVATPIRKLATAAGRIAAGELEVDPVVSPTGDEVEALARSFGIMSASISSMLSDLKNKADLERRLREEERELMDKERALREALFISLQDQIQPHFLFNALNTIARMALFENARETERLSLALGRMFRYALGAPESMVRVDAELTIVREYLSFQNLRFGDRLSWTIDALPATLGFGIPRFTIQPFVENAVRHGIEPKEDGGTVSVGVRNRGSRLYIHVHDTGVGMSRPAGTGIGVENVRKRLELRYGAAATLTIRSVHGRGTEVSVSMPAEPMEAGGVSP